MSSPSKFAESIRRVFQSAEGGVVGLVDNLLILANEHDLHLEWHAGECRASRVGVEPEEVAAVPMPLSAFRAALARLAALCNERLPSSVSPYCGEGELSTDAAPAALVHLSFVNTRDEQSLRLTRVRRSEHPRIPRGELAPIEPPAAPASGPQELR